MRSILKKALILWADKLWGIAAEIGKLNETVEATSKFVDLAPSDQADKSGAYSEAFEYALSRPKVSDIALTRRPQFCRARRFFGRCLSVGDDQFRKA